MPRIRVNNIGDEQLNFKPRTTSSQSEQPLLQGVFDSLSQILLYLRANPAEIDILDPISSLLVQGSSLTSRNSFPAHITASGIVLREGSMPVVKHGKLDKWLQPGGHIEPGERPIQAALREVSEETGLTSAVHPWHYQHPFPIDIDVHEIPENDDKHEPAHLHVDFRYFLTIGTRINPPELEWKYENFAKIELEHTRRFTSKIKEATLFRMK